MSNRIVPQIYRNIINDVEENIGVDFEEYGMDESVLMTLISKWEEKLLETKVAEFQRAQPPEDGDEDGIDHGHSRPHASGSQTSEHLSTTNALGNAGPSNGNQYQSPSQYGADRQYAGGLALPPMGYDDVRVKPEPDVIRPRGGAINDSRSSPPEPKPEPNAAGLLPGDEVIDSDLDDSEGDLDDDVDGDDDANVDYVFCVYDKVQRVKNKWKTVLKDGMIHINGKDYLFQKCNGEFEW